MALLTFGDMQTEVFDAIQNADFDATTLKRVLNRCYSHIRGFQDNRVYYVPANVSGASIAPQVGSLWKTLTEATYRNILEVYPAQNNAALQPFGPALGHMEQWELFAMQNEDPTDRQIYGSYFSAWRSGTTTPASVGRFNLGIWPVSSVVYDYLLGVLKEVAALVNASDKADASEEEDHFITDMAALMIARWDGRSEEWLGDIKGRLPEELQTAAAQVAKDIGLVKPRPGQVAA
jgi:hypothetical protein